MKVVYAKSSFFVGGVDRVDAGTVWPAEDPVVKANPDGFTDDPTGAPSFRASVRPSDAPVEQATRAPGERRVTRRG